MDAGCLTDAPSESLELARWARDYVLGTSLADKLAPRQLPVREAPARESTTDITAMPQPERLLAPGRPPELRLTWEKYKAPRSPEALRDAKKRAHLLHTFCHHELQAAELMCWAVLAFPETPIAFRRGLLGICLDEVRHMNLYAGHIRQLGFELGTFPVRDWFWQRTPSARTPAEFVSVMSLGFEAGNLDHSERYVRMFQAAGDPVAAALQSVVGQEELAHVEFGAHWFRRFAGALEFERWLACLPAPLSPMVMRGNPVARAARAAAGFDAAFLDELEAWSPR